ncbi:hypothetical protein BDV96DRAFT_559301 [Lophiotrema nucula]|uniref:Fe2OG dioxygenase domain-containing protein n=1 Tax=Lophiotrema nucula TaxID=690887 RepID=A0A6A5YI71_9PLEO|nr:hypothetical protein BDV96DRAFT_559301 [Lophiotrema nucula]
MKTHTSGVLDFSTYRTGSLKQRQEFVGQLDDAFRNDGFVRLINHGVDKDKVKMCFAWSAQFFSLPADVKMLAPHPPGASPHRGYSAIGAEKITQDVFDRSNLMELRQTPDMKESFESGHVSDERQPNIWLPEEQLPGFRAFMEDFYCECSLVVHSVLDALSTALCLPVHYFQSKHSHDTFQLRLLHYPSVSRKLLNEAKISRIGAHSDFGSLTLLFQDSSGGLEVESMQSTGNFQPVHPIGEIGDVLVVNLGDLMERWTNGRWKAVVHRVMGPAVDQRTEIIASDEYPARYSIPFFAGPNEDVVVEPLPGCWSMSNPKKFTPITAGVYTQKRADTSY